MKNKTFKYATLIIALAVGLGWGALLTNRLSAQSSPMMAKVTVKNFGFEPKEVTITVGGEVEWTDEGGRHTVQSDDGSFKSDTLTAGGKFTHKFEKAGRFAYFCMYHGAMGGKDMAGVVVVK